MKQSESIKTILESLGKAQAEFPTLPKEANGYNYKYTDLDTVITTLRPILTKHNIGFLQSLTIVENGRWGITTRLFHHSTGEWLEDTTPLPEVNLSKGNAAQNVGAAITYMKRYSLCAFLGVSCDEDPDGKPDGNPDFNARKNNQTNEAPKEKLTLAGGPDTPEQKKRINEILSLKAADGSKIFKKEDCDMVGKWRTEKTADEVITLLKEIVKERTAGEFPEDIPF